MNRIDRRQLLRLLLAGSATYPMATAAFFSGTDQPAQPRQVFRHRGSIKVNNHALTSATIIMPGDTIETGENSEIVFRLGKDAHLLRSNTIMSMNDNNGLVDALRLISGAVLSVFGTGHKKIETPVATIGIRGTGTYLEVADDETYICTCYGKTEMVSNIDPSVKETLTTTHHDSPRFIRTSSAGGASIVKAPARNHRDVELIMLESMVGRKPPFEKEEYDAMDGV